VFPVPEGNPTLEDDPVPDEDTPDPDEDNPVPDARPKRKSNEISKSHFHIFNHSPFDALFLVYLKPSLS